MKARIVQFVSDTPIVFIGAVLAIAITFRVGIGAIKTASAEPEPQTTAALHTPVGGPAKSPEKPPAEAATPATPAVAAEPMPVLTADPTLPKPGLPKQKKPRTHGKR